MLDPKEFMLRDLTRSYQPLRPTSPFLSPGPQTREALLCFREELGEGVDEPLFQNALQKIGVQVWLWLHTLYVVLKGSCYTTFLAIGECVDGPWVLGPPWNYLSPSNSTGWSTS